MSGLTRKPSESQSLHCPGVKLRAGAGRLDDQPVLRLGNRQGQGQIDRPLAAEGPARGPGDPRDLRAGVGFEPRDLDREVVALARSEERVRRVERGLADAAREVRHAQPREHPAVGERLRRKRHRHPDHRRRPRARFLPEHGSAPVVADPGTRRGQPGLRGQERAAGAADGQDEKERREQSPAPQREQQGRKAEEQNAPAANAAGLFLPKRNGTWSSSATAKVGMRLAGSRFRKSKISWPPGSRPVENVAQDTGVCAGIVGVSGE